MATTADESTASDLRREKRMSLAAHLQELRKRLMIAAAALLVAAVVAFFITDPVLTLLKWPIDVVANSRGESAQTMLMVTTVTGPFDLRMKIAFTIAMFVSAPIWLWQLYAFIMPGMTRKEVGYTAWFTAAAVPLFFAGCAVGLWVAPHVVQVMSTFTPGSYAAMYQANTYYDFIFKLLMSVGIAFLLPVLLVAINLAGVLSARDILKGWRVAILIATIFAAITTPGSDVTSMLILAGILIVLYFAATGVCFIFDRRRRKRQTALLSAEGTA